MSQSERGATLDERRALAEARARIRLVRAVNNYEAKRTIGNGNALARAVRGLIKAETADLDE